VGWSREGLRRRCGQRPSGTEGRHGGGLRKSGNKNAENAAEGNLGKKLPNPPTYHSKKSERTPTILSKTPDRKGKKTCLRADRKKTRKKGPERRTQKKPKKKTKQTTLKKLASTWESDSRITPPQIWGRKKSTPKPRTNGLKKR